MGLRHAAVCGAVWLFGITHPGLAQDVTLSSRDGKISISGQLLGYDGEFYRLDTSYGELTVDGTAVSCDGEGCPDPQGFVAELKISGSAVMGAILVPALVEGFALRHGYKANRTVQDNAHFQYHLSDDATGKLAGIFQFHVTTTDEGFADLLADDADMVMALREVRSDENTRAIDAGLGDLTDANRSRIIALDGIVPIVAPSNPVHEISVLNLARAFAGQITNWSDLGGPDAPIALHAPNPVLGLGPAIVDSLLAPDDFAMSPNVVGHDRGADIAQTVSTDPFALGIVSFAEAASAQRLALTGSCGRSLWASRRTIKTEDYPLTAPMFLYMPARRFPAIGRDFLAYTRGPSAQIVIRRTGFVDQAAEEISVNDQGHRFANAIAAAGRDTKLSELQRMVEVLAPMKRLTISYRFEAGSVRLDAHSRSNVQQLARELEQGRYDARRLVFVGFSDADGPASTNRKLAMDRAEAVRRAVVQAASTVDPDQITLDVDAFGEALPMACDETSWGRQVNRRVEVWVR